PLPMEAIEKMAALCMKDPDEEEEEDEELEDEDDLMAELQEVLGDGEGSAATPEPPAKVPVPEPDGIERTLTERAGMYRAAIANARQAGDGSRLRRYERGLKTLENLLVSVRKGKKIDEGEIPPPVALGKGPSSPQPSPASPGTDPAPSSLPSSHPGKALAHSPANGEAGNAALPSAPPGCAGAGAEALLRSRQREYKLLALDAKRRGDVETAAKLYRVAKSFDALLEMSAKGQPVEPSAVPPPPGPLLKEPSPPGQPRSVPEAPPVPPAAAVPAAPRDTLEALQQRMERYRAAAAQAKSKGDDRKARMHERIVKQYQDAIRAHKAGRTVDLSALPVPPGFQPIQGVETPSGDQSLAGVLETAMRLAGQEVGEEDEDDGAQEMKVGALGGSVRATAAVPNAPPAPRAPATGTTNSTGAAKAAPKTTAKAQQQLLFLEGRRKLLVQAALRAKQRNDVEGAKLFLRQAKGLEPMIEASRSGLPVDITKVPEAPVNREDFVLVQRRGVPIPPEAASRYLELVKLIRQQHEMCMSYSKQFTHLGNIAETTKFEKLAEDCRQNMELLRQAHARGCPPPKHRYEQRTFTAINLLPPSSSSSSSSSSSHLPPSPPPHPPPTFLLLLLILLPSPWQEEAQKDKTNVIKNTDSPEFKEQFKLYVNRAHRGLRRVLHTKGIKFEVAHKGGLFKPDRVVGTAQLKLEALETTCEVREILELLDGRRPTGGKLEVQVRLREPLSSQQLEPRTERWLVIEPGPAAPVSGAAG
ncbi:C2D1A protein, partial [Eurystomus gularis]|nr:C2D1A protein [Eurystomus gularis]